MEEKRIYVAVAGTIQTGPPVYTRRNVIQPIGRQIAQACHVVSKLRHLNVGMMFAEVKQFEPYTTIILQARDSNEMLHLFLLLNKKKLHPVFFSDTNPEYGPGSFPTAVAVLATKKQVQGIMDYLPLWGN